MRIGRVFPRRTKASPVDDLAFFDFPGMFPPEVDAVHVSVAFTWDLPRAEALAAAWRRVAPVEIGGPALGQPGGEFVPGRYLRPGYVITSRGCPNRCWFCSVWRREGGVRELPITDGWNVLDDNLLACSTAHILSVFDMLKRQPRRAEFTGGLEAARLTTLHVDLLSLVRPNRIFFAYDTADDFDPLRLAAAMLREAGFTAHHLRCYVLIGYPGDTMEKAERRLRSCVNLGMDPMAMLWRDEDGRVLGDDWKPFQRLWTRPAIFHAHGQDYNGAVAPR
jgi:hypothetical protein